LDKREDFNALYKSINETVIIKIDILKSYL